MVAGRASASRGRWAARLACLFFALLVAAAAIAPAGAADKPKILRYMSQRNAKANLRQGPGYNYRILWVYRHRGYPFAVIASFDIWRRVMAADGTVGWMSVTMLSDTRTVLVRGKGRAPVRESAKGGRVVGLAAPGAIADLKTCTATMCRIAGGGIDGWVARSRLWGVSPGETFQ